MLFSLLCNFSDFCLYWLPTAFNYNFSPHSNNTSYFTKYSWNLYYSVFSLMSVLKYQVLQAVV